MLAMDMFSYETSDSGHVNGFQFKKKKEETQGACCPKDWWRGWLYHLNGLLFQKTPHERVARDQTFLSFFFSRAMDPQRSKVPKWSLKEKARPARTELPWPHFSWHLPRQRYLFSIFKELHMQEVYGRIGRGINVFFGFLSHQWQPSLPTGFLVLA